MDNIGLESSNKNISESSMQDLVVEETRNQDQPQVEAKVELDNQESLSEFARTKEAMFNEFPKGLENLPEDFPLGPFPNRTFAKEAV